MTHWFLRRGVALFTHCGHSRLCLHSLSSQHAVQQQPGMSDPGASRASAQPHVPWKAPSPAHPGALLRLPVAEVCPELLPLLHQWAPAAVEGLYGAQASESRQLASNHWYKALSWDVVSGLDWSTTVLIHVYLLLDSGLSILSSLVKLQYLNLASCSKLTDSCLQHIRGQSCERGSDSYYTGITNYATLLHQQL